jgi:microcystin-dependent protein
MLDMPLIGTVSLFAGNFPPRGWVLCDGSIASIQLYPELFLIIGTTYGGDGVTTFGLPDVRGREAVHAGHSGPFVLGQSGGQEATTLTLQNLPAHDHDVALPVYGIVGRLDDPSGNILSFSTDNGDYGPPAAANGQMGGVTEANVGSSQPIPFRSPFLALNYVIAVEGEFPSR